MALAAHGCADQRNAVTQLRLPQRQLFGDPVSEGGELRDEVLNKSHKAVRVNRLDVSKPFRQPQLAEEFPRLKLVRDRQHRRSGEKRQNARVHPRCDREVESPEHFGEMLPGRGRKSPP